MTDKPERDLSTVPTSELRRMRREIRERQDRLRPTRTTDVTGYARASDRIARQIAAIDIELRSRRPDFPSTGVKPADPRASGDKLLRQAESALRSCESRMQDLVAEAAASGHYDEIERLTGFARSLDEMGRRARSARLAERSAEQAFEGRAGAPTDPSWPSLPPERPTPTSRARRAATRAAYPRFARDGDDLVKVGWSKSRDDEYAQRAGRSQVEAVASWLANRGSTSAPIGIDDILAVRETDGSEIPSYQVYVALAWLRQLGLVERIGRKGYAVTDAHTLGDQLAKHWGALPEFAASR